MGCSLSSPEEKFNLQRSQTAKMNTEDVGFKCVLLGDKNVGKSSVANRFINNSFNGEEEATLGAAFLSKKVSLKSSKLTKMKKSVTLLIWDTSGEERYRSMTRFYFRNAVVGLLVFDLTSHESYVNLKKWYADFLDQCPQSSVIVIGNKLDLTINANLAAVNHIAIENAPTSSPSTTSSNDINSNRAVSSVEVALWCKQHRFPYFETSALDATNISVVFEKAAQLCIEQTQDK